jgi:hypothetical protein
MDRREGSGTLSWPSGEKYVGQFKDYKFNGKGVHSFKTGMVYRGSFANN